MSTSVTVANASYTVPAIGDTNWGNNVSNLLIALSTSSKVLQTNTTTFTLLSGDVDFGATYGLKSGYFKSRSSNISSTGVVRLANTESVGWRNAANGADVLLKVNASDRLEYNAVAIPTISSTDTLTNKTISGASNTLSNIAYSSLSLTGTIVNADISASAAIAYSKLNLATSIVNADISGSAAIAYSKLNLSGAILNADINASAAIAYSKLAALTASRVLVSDGSGVVSASSVTSTTLGYLDVSSSLTTLLAAKAPLASPALTGSPTITNNQAAISYVDITNSTNGGGSVIRQIVRNIANTSTTSCDIAKLTGGAWAFNNNDTHANNYTSFGIGGAEIFRINSVGMAIGTTPTGTAKLSLHGALRFTNNVSASDIYTGIGAVAADTVGIATGGTERMRISSTGNVTFSDIHNNASPPTNTTQTISSGTYTPTLTSVANVDGTTSGVCNWSRIGNVVTVSGNITVNPTAATTATHVGISLPIASAMTLNSDLNGVGNGYIGSVAGGSGVVVCDTTNDRAQLQYNSVGTGDHSVGFCFQYLVK